MFERQRLSGRGFEEITSSGESSVKVSEVIVYRLRTSQNVKSSWLWVVPPLTRSSAWRIRMTKGETIIPDFHRRRKLDANALKLMEVKSDDTKP